VAKGLLTFFNMQEIGIDYLLLLLFLFINITLNFLTEDTINAIIAYHKRMFNI